MEELAAVFNFQLQLIGTNVDSITSNDPYDTQLLQYQYKYVVVTFNET